MSEITRRYDDAAVVADVYRMRHSLQVTEMTRRYDDAAVVTDVYRVAFEEQLERNKELLRRLGDLTLTPPHMSRTEKAKAAVKWLIKQLNEGQLVL